MNITLSEAEQIYFYENLPTVIYLIFVSVIGTFGNIHTIIIYLLHYKPSHHRIFILFLAFVDIIPCCFLIPDTIVFSLRYRYTLNVDVNCKLLIFFVEAFGLSSVTILTVFSIERYFKICCSVEKHFSCPKIKIVCCLVISGAFFFCIPFLIYFGNDYPMQDSHVWKTCTVLNMYRDKIIFRSYLVTIFGLCILMFITATVAYLLLGCSLYTQNRRSVFENVHEMNNDFDFRPRRHSSFGKPTKTIFMFFMATFISYVFFLSAQITVFLLTYWDSGLMLQSLGRFYGILLRFHYMSHAVNPIVYGFLDIHFRQKCKQLYKCSFVNIPKFSSDRPVDFL
ncbi:hypothetical protein KUTeg_021145 [Tegillarca granosa]|uniref:G-protein coupled receptors family 1 profile domain-containing protein n=1 Tax=Tegillarca granosa TaxID=220873 RepID=A0ABQ9EFX5_TEGGR|nr:hypothetical protein KUTeg_021145 [Tegillarca granosa]